MEAALVIYATFAVFRFKISAVINDTSKPTGKISKQVKSTK